MQAPRVIGEPGSQLAERPVWDLIGQALWWVDILAPAVHRWNAIRDEVRTWRMSEPVGSLALRADGGLLVALKHGPAFFDPRSGEVTPAAQPHLQDDDLRFNDGKCDMQGRFWCNTMGQQQRTPRGSLYCLERGGIRPVLHGFTVPNGPCFSPDGTTMYLTDSPTRTVWAYPLDPETGALGERRLLAEVQGPGVPDGLTADAEGFVWWAEHGAGRISRCAPDGRLDRQMDVPVSQPTCLAFGGPDLSTLFVSSARQGLSAAQLAEQPLAGAVLAYEIGIRGQPEQRYAN